MLTAVWIPVENLMAVENLKKIMKSSTGLISKKIT